MSKAIIFMMRTAVGSVMATVFVAILTNKAKTEIVKYVPAAAIKAGLPQSSLTDLFNAIAAGTPTAMASVPGINTKIEAAVASSLATAYAAAYAYVYYAAIATGLVGLIACISIRDYDHLFTSHIPRQIYRPGAQQQQLNEKEGNLESIDDGRSPQLDSTHKVSTVQESSHVE